MEDKMKARKEKEDKREEMRKQMREDLRKKVIIYSIREHKKKKSIKVLKQHFRLSLHNQHLKSRKIQK